MSKDYYKQRDGMDRYAVYGGDCYEHRGKAEYGDDGHMTRLDIISTVADQPGYHHHEWCKMVMLFTSDLHLGHNNILPSRQQFQDINEHDDTLIFKWNNKVKKNDDVYILGDLSFRSPHHF